MRAKRLAWQEEGRARARELDPTHLGGCMLFWAEGTKARNTVSLTNSDPYLLRYFCDFLRHCFGVSDLDFRVALHVYLTNGLIDRVDREVLAFAAQSAAKLPAKALP
jgi:hypothetical protein